MIYTFYIKDMICPRCIRVVERILIELEVKTSTVELGKITVEEKVDEETLSLLLQQEGFEILKDSSTILTEKVKKLLLDLCHNNKFAALNSTLSYHLADQLNLSYSSICASFKKVENRSVEEYWQLLRIERTKELLEYNEFSLEDISLQVGYGSQQALSKAFKKVTGLSPRAYKNLDIKFRKTYDTV